MPILWGETCWLAEAAQKTTVGPARWGLRRHSVTYTGRCMLSAQPTGTLTRSWMRSTKRVFSQKRKQWQHLAREESPDNGVAATGKLDLFFSSSHNILISLG